MLIAVRSKSHRKKKYTDNRTFYIRPATNVVVVILHLMTDINFMSLFLFVLFFFVAFHIIRKMTKLRCRSQINFLRWKFWFVTFFSNKKKISVFTSEMLYSCTFLFKTTTFVHFHCMQFLIQVLLKSGLVQNALVTFFLAINL